jgi:hypothetical protein
MFSMNLHIYTVERQCGVSQGRQNYVIALTVLESNKFFAPERA